jgi:predicted alpha/beta superfamily hydrolase
MRTPGLLLALVVLAVVPACRTAPPADPIPAHETFRLTSRFLSEERVVNVYLPPAYAASPDQSFRIVYMPDGGIGEDFPHIVNTLAALDAEGAIDPAIVVGIENTQRRRDMTGPTTVAKDREIAPVVGGSAAFRSFIRDELMPEVAKRYRGHGDTAIVGESAAGLFIMETFFLEPTLFDTYIALSPSLWWSDHALVRDAAASIRKTAGLGLTLYLGSADEADVYPHTDALAAILEKEAPSDLTWNYQPRRDLKHATIYRAVSGPAFRQVFAVK